MSDKSKQNELSTTKSMIHFDVKKWFNGIKQWLKYGQEDFEVFKTWKKVWNEVGQSVKYPYELSWFEGQFERQYKAIVRKKVQNKRLNFFWKGLFTIALLTFLEVCLRITSEMRQTSQALGDILLMEAIYTIFAMWICSAIAQWINTKKYQETWTRHSKMKNDLEREMIKFIYHLEDYVAGNRLPTFMQSVLRLTERNMERFGENMHKESNVMGVFNYIKPSITKNVL